MANAKKWHIWSLVQTMRHKGNLEMMRQYVTFAALGWRKAGSRAFELKQRSSIAYFGQEPLSLTCIEALSCSVSQTYTNAYTPKFWFS